MLRADMLSTGSTRMRAKNTATYESPEQIRRGRAREMCDVVAANQLNKCCSHLESHSLSVSEALLARSLGASSFFMALVSLATYCIVLFTASGAAVASSLTQ